MVILYDPAQYPLARALCAFFALFWTLRLVAATFVFDLRPYLTNRYRRIGYHATNIVFAYLPIVYGIAAISNSAFFVHNTHYVFGSLNTWGWVVRI